jgi:hypothetical protein
MKRRHLVRLFSMLMLRLTLEAISSVHVLSLMITSVDVHVFGVQPLVQTVRKKSGSNFNNSHLYAKASRMTSIDHDPRSTRSPFMRR